MRLSITHFLNVPLVIAGSTEYDQDWYLPRDDTEERGRLGDGEWIKVEPPNGHHPTSPFDRTTEGQNNLRIRNECASPCS